MDWEPLILGVVIFDLLLSIWLARMVVFSAQAAVAGLDTKLAEAITGLLERGMGDFEPPNPIQLALADFLKSRLAGEGQGNPIEILRDNDGKFAG